MPAAFELSHDCPAHLNVPDTYRFDYMVFRLFKILNCNIEELKSMSEKDFWMYMAFENLDNKRRQYQLEQDKK